MVGFVDVADYGNSSLYSGAGDLLEASHELFRVVPEVTISHLAITLLAAFIVFFGLFSGFIKEKMFVGEAIIATVFGIAVSGYAAGLFAPRTWSQGHHFDEITLVLTRIVIALSVFAVGVELPKAYVARHWKSLAVLLGPVMLMGWLISGGLMYAIIPGLDFLPALVIAAGVTPTDPILASSVVGKGKFAQDHVPAHIRHILQAESGCNDGAAFPFLYLALFLYMREDHTVGQAIGYWFILVVLYQIVLGIIIGTVVGIAARKLLKFSKRRKLIDRESMVAMYVALALFVTGVTTLAGSDDLLAAFACGTAFAWDDWFSESIEDSNFSSTIDLLLNCTVFIYLGATMPFNAWSDASLTLTPWRLILLAIAILVLRRLPIIFAIQYYIPDIKTRREAVFAGHFGPMGVGAIFISTLAASKLPTPRIPPQDRMDLLALTIQPITYFIVLSSILIHGLTISFFSLGRRVHSRVQSISRTFTQASGNGEEPSWMSRVKRVRSGDDIIVNRDDDDEIVEKAEKGEGSGPTAISAGGSDGGILAMFGAPSSSSGGETATGSAESSIKKVDGEEVEDDPEQNEHPRENVLGDAPSDRDSHRDHEGEIEHDEGPDVSSKKHEVEKMPAMQEDQEGEEESQEHSDHMTEAQYCKSAESTSWKEGRQVIIDHGDGTDVEIIEMDPSPSQLRHVDSGHQVVHIPHTAIKEEKDSLRQSDIKPTDEGAVKRFMKRRGSLVAAALTPKHDGLTSEQKEVRRKAKLERDAWCMKEKHYRDKEEANQGREWREGKKIVTERGDDDIDVRDMTPAEIEARAARHIAALKALGKPLEVVEAELLKLKKSISNPHEQDYSPRPTLKGKERTISPSDTSPRGASPEASTSHTRGETTPPNSRPSNPGLSLTRTDRIEQDEDEWENEDAPTPASPSTSPSTRSTLGARPLPPPRANSKVRAMRQLLFHRDKSPERRGRQGTDSNRGSRGPSPARSIRFAEGVRPDRDSMTGNFGSTGRTLPVVGSGLGMRRVPTIPRPDR